MSYRAISIEEPDWVAEARANYTGGVGPEYSETSLAAGRLANEILKERILSRIDGGLDILLVGAGMDAGPIYGSYEPYRISGFLESLGRAYRMKIVDKDPSVIADLRSRKNIFVSNAACEQRVWHAKEWAAFLEHSGQSDELIHELVDGLDLATYVLGDWLLPRYLKSGFRMARIPRQFEEKLESGELSLLNADIATAELGDDGFDFVSCPNVWYLLPPDGQKLAVYNTAKHTKPGGLVLTNDLGYTGTPLLPRQGGWFTAEKQREVGLVLEEVLSSKERSQTLLFRKE